MTDLAATGDGVLTALHVLAIMAKADRSLADLSSCVVKLPQVLVNVSGVDKDAVASNDAVTRAVEEAESATATAEAVRPPRLLLPGRRSRWSRAPRRPRRSPRPGVLAARRPNLRRAAVARTSSSPRRGRRRGRDAEAAERCQGPAGAERVLRSAVPRRRSASFSARSPSRAPYPPPFTVTRVPHMSPTVTAALCCQMSGHCHQRHHRQLVGPRCWPTN